MAFTGAARGAKKELTGVAAGTCRRPPPLDATREGPAATATAIRLRRQRHPQPRGELRSVGLCRVHMMAGQDTQSTKA